MSTTAHQSKGCQFDHVVLGSDFRVPMEQGKLFEDDRIMRPGQQEELNLLYVVMTGARLRLQHSKKTWEFMMLLQHQFDDDDADFELDIEEVDLSDLRAQNEKQWRRFEATPGTGLTVRSIPWPQGDNDGQNVLALDSMLSSSDIAGEIRKWRLRLHPDRFLPKYDTLIRTKSLSSVRDKLTYLLDAIGTLKTDFLLSTEENDH